MRLLALMAALLSVLALTAEAYSAGRVQAPKMNVSVAVSKGVLISLPEPAKTVFVADPEIASFQVAGESRVLVFGRMPDWAGLGLYMAVALLVAWLGFAWFQKTRKGFADVL